MLTAIMNICHASSTTCVGKSCKADHMKDPLQMMGGGKKMSPILMLLNQKRGAAAGEGPD